jgi:hypothetical protein
MGALSFGLAKGLMCNLSVWKPVKDGDKIMTKEVMHGCSQNPKLITEIASMTYPRILTYIIIISRQIAALVCIKHIEAWRQYRRRSCGKSVIGINMLLLKLMLNGVRLSFKWVHIEGSLIIRYGSIED